MEITEIEAIFSILEKYGIDRVIVSYDGSGDSGEVYNTQLDGKVECIETINQNSNIDMEKFKKVGVTFCKDNIMDCVESISMKIVGDKEGGWENNDGARGDVFWHINLKQITLEHQQRVMEYEDREYHIPI